MFKLFPAATLVLCLITGATAQRAFAQADPAAVAISSPEAQAVKCYQNLRDQNWKAWFYLMEFSPKAKESLKDMTAEAFAADVLKGYNGSFKTPEEKERADNLFKSIAGIMVGEAVITGNQAAVPTSAKITINGKVMVFTGVAHLIMADGIWKFDLTISDDTEQATSQRVAELLGKPDPAP